MNTLLIIFLLVTTGNDWDKSALKSGFNSNPLTCEALDFMKLQNKQLQDNFLKQIDSIRYIQYPINDQETEIMVDINQNMLIQFLNDIDQATLAKTGRYEHEYHFNISSKPYSDPPACKDKISIEFDLKSCNYRMVIWNTFLVEYKWCTESQVVYSFAIKNNKIIAFGRNEAG